MSNKTTIYLIGSLRNPKVTDLEIKLREYGFDPFGSWIAAGPEADDQWQAYCNKRGLTYKQALADWSAQHVFEFDRFHLNRCDAAVLVLPAGKSGHIEMGYMAGLGKRVFVLFDAIPDRYDVMYNFAHDTCFSEAELIESICKAFPVRDASADLGRVVGEFPTVDTNRKYPPHSISIQNKFNHHKPIHRCITY